MRIAHLRHVVAHVFCSAARERLPVSTDLMLGACCGQFVCGALDGSHAVVIHLLDVVLNFFGGGDLNARIII